MLAVLSPAKKLDFEPAPKNVKATLPTLSKQTAELLDVTRKLKPKDLKALMKLSDSLAKLNHERFQRFSSNVRKAEERKQAALAFDGDTYVGLRANEFDAADLSFAQEHLRILSGLYGLLRPLDLIQPYRLEMGTRLKTPRGGSLYEFWGDDIARALNTQAKKIGTETLVNLASNEYFAAVAPGALKPRVITAVFKEKRGSKLSVIGFSAKRGRGMMARFIVKERLDRPEGMKDFSESGYRFQPKLSGADELVFVR